MRVVNSASNSGSPSDGGTVQATMEVPVEADRITLSVDDGSDGSPANHDLDVTTDGDGELSNAMFRAAKRGNSTFDVESFDAAEGTLTITVTNQSGGSATFRIQALALSRVR